MLKYWPNQNSYKQALFLAEVEQLLQFTPPDQFQIFMVPLFKQIARSLRSHHFQVAERALYLWSNEYIGTLICDFREVLFPIVFEAMYVNSSDHWNPTVLNLSQNVLQMYIDSDAALYDRCLQAHQLKKNEKVNAAKLRKQRWEQLENQVAKKKDSM